LNEFERIYRQYFGGVYQYALSLTKNPTFAEDVVQDTFWKAMKNADQLDDVTNLNAWLCRIAKNTYLDELAKSKRNIPILEMDFRSDTDIEETRIQDEQVSAINGLLGNLDDPYKTVFSLRTISNKSFRDIGLSYGKSEVWARQVFRRARIKIKEKLK